MKRKTISFLLTILMLMQVFVCLPVMAEESVADTTTSSNLFEAVVANIFMYEDENISSVQIDDSEGFWYDNSTASEVRNAMKELRWAVYYKTTIEDPVIDKVLSTSDYWQTIIITPRYNKPSIRIETGGNYAYAILNNEYYVMSSKAVSGYNLMSNKKVHYLIVDGYIVDDDEKIENIFSSYHNYVFIEASEEDVERVTSSVWERISISTSDGDAQIYITAEDVVYVSESGDWYIRTTRIPAEIETFVEPDIEDETESEVESDTVIEIGPDMEPEVQDTGLCIGYDFLFPYKVEAIYINGPDFEDYVQNPQKTNDYIITYACLPYYKDAGFNHPVVEEVRDSADATRIYYGYPDGTWSVQIYAGDKYVALYDDKWYVGANDVIPGQNLFAERGLAQTVKDGDILYKGIDQTSMFFEQYALHCFRETDRISAQDVISHGREIVIDYYYYGLSYIYVYGEQMVVINHDGKIYSLVYVGHTGSEPETEPETTPGTEPETEPDTESDTTLGTEPETEPDTGSNTNPETTPVVKPKPTPVGKRFSFKPPMPIYFDMPVLDPEPLENFIVRPPFYRNRFLNVKFENFITWIRRSIK